MTEARVIMTRQKQRKGKKPVEERKEKVINVEDLADDDNILMKVAKSRTIGRALPYGQFKISDTTTVELCCNQDTETAKKANSTCRKLVKKFMKQDLKESEEIYEEEARQMLEDLGE
jgi:hypothetical protein